MGDFVDQLEFFERKFSNLLKFSTCIMFVYVCTV